MSVSMSSGLVRRMNVNVGLIAGKAVGVAVSLLLGVLVSVYIVGGWGTHSEMQDFERRRRGEPDPRKTKTAGSAGAAKGY